MSSIPGRAAILVALCLFVSREAGSQPMTLVVHGGGIGETLTLTLDGPPGSLHLLLASFTTGPTPWPGQPVGSLDVGFDLLIESLGAPGFLGVLDGGGQHVIALPVPVDPLLDDLNLNFQAVRIAAGNSVVEKTNLWRVTFDNPGEFAPTLGEMNQARAFAAYQKLDDGSVLVSGGGNGTITSATGLRTAELYRPNLEAFESLPDMLATRALHRATRLQDGRILLTGGVNILGNPTNKAEIFDPQTNSFMATADMSIARVGHSASLLPDGRVLIAGGSSSLADATAFATSALASTELFDPAGTGSFSAGPGLSQPKTVHDAVTLANGKLLISGGISFIVIIIPLPGVSSVAQLYTPNPAGSGSFGGNQSMTVARAGHSSILLDDGRVLLAGGASGSLLAPVVLATCELFKEGSGFSSAAGMATARALPCLNRLTDGTIFASGGFQGDLTNPVSLSSCELYTAAPPAGPGGWSPRGSMTVTRSGHGCVLLDDGTLALIGGGGGTPSAALKSAEIHQP